MRDLLLRVPRFARRWLAFIVGVGIALLVGAVVVPDGWGYWPSYWVGFALGAVFTFPALYLGIRWERMEASTDVDPAA